MLSHQQHFNTSTTRLPASTLSGGLSLKRRSWSLSSDYSSTSYQKFSLPFKKRRFVLIDMDYGEDEGTDKSRPRNSANEEHSLIVPAFSSSTSSDELDHSSSSSTTTSAHALSIVSPRGSSLSPSTVEGTNHMIACITPVPGTPKHRSLSTPDTTAIPNKLLVVGKPSSTSDEETPIHDHDNDDNHDDDHDDANDTAKASQAAATTALTVLASAAVREPMKTRQTSRRNSANHSTTAVVSPPALTVGKRIIHPKLTSPLPNGCHGQSNRTQSYCRRGPNYNGSNYCKLHYFDPRFQSAIAADAAAAAQKVEMNQPNNTNESNKNSDNNCSSDKDTTEIATTAAAVSGTRTKMMDSKSQPIKTMVLPSALPSALPSNNKNKRRRTPRDKLFRGTQTETRCLAISTRGKRCCYAAVDANGNHYCHRHSSFYVAGASPVTTQQQQQQQQVLEQPQKLQANETNGTMNNALGHTTTAATPTTTTATRPPTALSNLSTDMWKNRKVVISKGPHKSKIGTVVWWRNGWVTVELEKKTTSTTNKEEDKGEPKEEAAAAAAATAAAAAAVYHNRRSYELFLA